MSPPLWSSFYYTPLLEDSVLEFKFRSWVCHVPAAMYIVFTLYQVFWVIQTWLRVYERMCIGYTQILYHFRKGTWASVDLGICRYEGRLHALNLGQTFLWVCVCIPVPLYPNFTLMSHFWKVKDFKHNKDVKIKGMVTLCKIYRLTF